MDKATLKAKLFERKTTEREIEGVGAVMLAYPKWSDVQTWMDAADGDSQAISDCLVDPAITAEEAADLPTDTRTALVHAVLEVAGLDPTNSG